MIEGLRRSLLVAVASALPACATTSSAPGGTTADFFTPTEERMLAAVVDSIIATLPGEATTCLIIDNRDDWPVTPSAELLAHLAAPTVVTRSECPETYQQMVQPMDSLGQPVPRTPPPGHVDPFHIRIFRLSGDPADGLAMTVNDSQGTQGRTHTCNARMAQQEIRVSCRLVSRWTS